MIEVADKDIAEYKISKEGRFGIMMLGLESPVVYRHVTP